MKDDYVKNNSSLHKLQCAEYKKQGKNTPIGLIKFIDNKYINELADKDVITFNNVKNLKPQNNDENGNIRRDKTEGKYCFKGIKEIEIENIMEQYHIQTYTTSFTLLYKDDFDKDGYLGKDKINLLNSLEKDEDNRPFVIINFKEFQDKICKLYINTPRLINEYIPSPEVDVKTNIATIFGGELVRRDLCCYINNDNQIDKSLKQKIKKQLLHCKNLDYDSFEALCNSGLINPDYKGKTLENFTFHGGYVYYDDHFDPFTEKAKDIINNNNEFSELSTDVQRNFCSKLIECCITLKEKRYTDEEEYRLLISNFSYNKEFDRIKLIAKEGTCGETKYFPFLRYEFEHLKDLKKEDFDNPYLSEKKKAIDNYNDHDS